MTDLKDLRRRITYQDFNYLLKQNKWILFKSLKDNWVAKDHLDYIDNIIHYNPDCLVDFYIDSNLFKCAQKIDVFITPSSSNPKKQNHIQFVRTNVASE